MADKWKKLIPNTGWTETVPTVTDCPETPVAP